MEDEAVIIENAQKKIELEKRRKDVAILKQVLEPIEEAMSELKDALENSIKIEKKEQVYFDKDFNSSLVTSLDKLLSLIKSFKQPEFKIDLSPITSIASEIKKGNDSIMELLSRPNQSDELYRMISAMVGRQNAFIEKGFTQVDYSAKFDALAEAINKKDDRVMELSIVYDQSGTVLKKVVPMYKK